jgi:hypothetical protein
MTDVVFCKTRHHYDSYSDFFTLAELSGYPVIYLDEMDIDDASKTYIFSPSNGECPEAGWQGASGQPKARIIHWLLEWVDEVKPIPGVSEVWASVQAYAKKLGVRYVPLGSHHKLAGNDNGRTWEKRYEFAALMYWNPRRLPLRREIESAGFTIAPNGWGQERHEILSQSRAMLHLHQWDEYPYAAPLRWAIAAAYQLPVVAERGEYESFYESSGMIFSPQGNWFEAYRFVHAGTMGFIGERFHQWLCHEMNFRTLVEAAV